MPSAGKTAMAPEYAKCKNPAGDFTIAVSSIGRSLNTALETCDDRKSFIACNGPIAWGTQAAHAGGKARARGSRSAQESCRGERQARGQGVSGSEGPGTDEVWRLGEQGHRLGFLVPKQISCAIARLVASRVVIPGRE